MLVLKCFKTKHFKINHSKTIKLASDLISDIIRYLCVLIRCRSPYLYVTESEPYYNLHQNCFNTPLILMKMNAYESSLNEKIALRCNTKYISKNVSLNDFYCFHTNFPCFEEIKKAIKARFSEFPFSFQNNNSEWANDREGFLPSRYNNLGLTTTERGIHQDFQIRSNMRESSNIITNNKQTRERRDNERGILCRRLQNSVLNSMREVRR